MERWSRRPRYVRNFVWSEERISLLTSAMATIYAPPCPEFPSNELSNLSALSTIRENPNLFRVVSPINLTVFERLLSMHPNTLFVRSVCNSLKQGFWPWANTLDMSRPDTYDNSCRPIKTEEHAAFVRSQRDVEITLGQFSESFGTDLLPGMYSMPIGVVPKPHSDKLRMVFDHSAEPYSLNSLIPKEERSVHLDNLADLGRILRRVRCQYGRDLRLVLFKSDVSRAYRLMPMHPLWQIRQIVTIDGHRHVDRCNQFGNGAAGRVWGCFIALVLWIAIFIYAINDLLGYVDDEFSWEFAFNTKWYPPYNKFLPTKQANLLYLWDLLGIPHEERKQVFSTPLTIIGFEVDPNAMTITMPLDARSDLIRAVRPFAVIGTRRPLRDFQRLAGWINWALNVYPLLRPGLSTMYEKMKPRRSASFGRSGPRI
jgi:hypothetical protein